MKERIFNIERDKQAVDMQLEKEKRSRLQLQELVDALKAGRTGIEQEFTRVTAERDRLHAEVQQYASARQQLTQVRSRELNLLSKAITDAYSTYKGSSPE